MDPVSSSAIAIVVLIIFVMVRHPKMFRRLATPVDAILDVANLKVNDLRDQTTKEIVVNGKKNAIKQDDLESFLGNQVALKSAREAILS